MAFREQQLGPFLDAVDYASTLLQSETDFKRELTVVEGLVLQAISDIVPERQEFTRWRVWQTIGRSQSQHRPIYDIVTRFDEKLNILDSREDPSTHANAWPLSGEPREGSRRRRLYTPTSLGLRVISYFDPPETS